MHSRAAGPTLEYITRTFVREPNYIAASRAKGEELRPGMQVSPYEGHLLSWLVRISGAKRILEIGTFMATSTLWLTEGAGEDGQVTALEFAADYAALARNHVAASPHKNRIEIVHTDAHAWIAAQPSEPMFDLVFIDAEKPGYARYLEAVLPRMNPRGFIVGDNTLLFGVLSGEHPAAASKSAKESMAKFNETLADNSRFESILLPTPEGLTVARIK